MRPRGLREAVERKTKTRRSSDDELAALEAEVEHERLAESHANGSYWSPEHCTLSNLTFTVRRGRVLAVAGPVGCGKSSLLEALLGECDLVRGRATAKAGAGVAFAAQAPHIFAKTLRENVAIGAENNHWVGSAQVS